MMEFVHLKKEGDIMSLKRFKMPQPPPPKAVQVNVDLDTLKDLTCKSCTGLHFISALRFKRVPAIVSPTGKPDLAVLNVVVCITCSTELDLKDVVLDFEPPTIITEGV